VSARAPRRDAKPDEYFERVFASGVPEHDLPVIQPLLQHRIAPTSSSFVRLLGSGAFGACRLSARGTGLFVYEPKRGEGFP
jgi:hypothetical protein